ncbi:MAG TPA: ROK family protein [Isosphaeraceae bacterium]
MGKPLLLGIEIGGTKLQLGLGHGDGRLLSLRRVGVDPARGAAGVLEQVAEEARKVVWAIDARLERVEAVGVGFGGPVDAARGVVTTSHQVPGWDGFALADWVRRELGAEAVVVQNDADTAGLGEARFGAGVDRSPLVYVTVGSGIGAGLILDGRIYRGGGLGAMEIGHLRVGEADPGDRDGLPATLEQVASGWSIAREARRRVAEALRADPARVGLLADLVSEGPGRPPEPEAITTEVVAMAAELGDAVARAILDRAARALAVALGHVVALLAPRRIILGGGVSSIGEALWLAPIRRELDRRAFPPFRGTFDVVPAALGQEVVVHGALALAREAWAARDL